MEIYFKSEHERLVMFKWQFTFVVNSSNVLPKAVYALNTDMGEALLAVQYIGSDMVPGYNLPCLRAVDTTELPVLCC